METRPLERRTENETCTRRYCISRERESQGELCPYSHAPPPERSRSGAGGGSDDAHVEVALPELSFGQVRKHSEGGERPRRLERSNMIGSFFAAVTELPKTLAFENTLDPIALSIVRCFPRECAGAQLRADGQLESVWLAQRLSPKLPKVGLRVVFRCIEKFGKQTARCSRRPFFERAMTR